MDERERRIQGTVLTAFGRDQWTVGDAVEGVQIFGATGSGKTSGSGATLARAFLDPGRGDYGGFGGVVLTAKGDEHEAWDRLLKKAGRGGDLLTLEPYGDARFNFLAYEQSQTDGGELTQNLVSLFLDALSGGGEANSSKADPYWADALRELLTHAVDLAVLGGFKRLGSAQGKFGLDLSLLFEIVRSAPQSLKEAQSSEWRNSSQCAHLLVEAERRRGGIHQGVGGAGRTGDLDQTQSYWLRDFPMLSDRPRSIIVSSFTAKAAGLLRSPLRELLCTGPSDGAGDKFAPEQTFNGKVIVVNIPVNKFDEVGKFAQILYKTIWQRAVLRRKLKGEWRPVFLWADESQYFVTKRDALFQQTARSNFASTVYLTQNLPNYQAALGGGGGVEASESLLGNLQTKIFHANGDPATNEWAERVFARRDVPSVSGGGIEGRARAHTSMGAEAVVPAARFTSLRTGGFRDKSIVDGYVMQAGRKLMHSGDDVHPVSFKQKF